MKLTHYIYIIGIVATLTSCNKWLDVQPQSQIEDTELFGSESGFKEALAGVYSSMVNSNTYTKEMTYGFIGILGQEWDYFYSAQYDDALAFDYDAAYPTNMIRGIWSANYTSIANVNNLLAHIDDNPKLFNNHNHGVIKGEALALRAFLHFDLLRCFGVSYSVNPDMPSIPYSTALSYHVFPQLTVKEAAQSVLADLMSADSLLKANDPVATGEPVDELVDNGYLLNRQLHLNYYAVKALEARLYMWMGEYAKALDASLDVIKSEQFTWSDAYNMERGYDRSLADEHIFALNNLTMQADVADVFFSESSARSFAVTRDRLLEYYDNATQDYRYTFLFKNGAASLANNRYIMKYDLPSSATNTYYMYKMPLIRISEMFLAASECMYRMGNAEGARVMLNNVRQARNLTAMTAEVFEASDYYDELIREYRREFLGEGVLFFLYKRLNRTIMLNSNIDAVATKAYTFPLPLTETESAERLPNR